MKGEYEDKYYRGFKLLYHENFFGSVCIVYILVSVVKYVIINISVIWKDVYVLDFKLFQNIVFCYYGKIKNAFYPL